MTALWLGIALLTLCAVAIVMLPVVRLQRQPSETKVDRKGLNIAIYEERVAELEAELDASNLDKESFDALKLELERNLLEDVSEAEPEAVEPKVITLGAKLTAVTLAFLVSVMALSIYAKYGHHAELEMALNPALAPQHAEGEMPTMEQAIAQLEARLAAQPENAQGWYMLANTYMGLEQFDKAVTGFANVMKYLPQDAPQYAGVSGRYAQALFYAKGGKMDPQIRQVIDQTLALEPLEIAALGLLGIEAFEMGNYRAAMEYWLKALPNADGQPAESLRSGIRSARERLIEAGEEVAEIPELKQVELRLNVSLDKSLLAQVDPQQSVFIFARPVGGRMPLAAVRLTVADLPTMVVLDDSLAMQPQSKLSSVDEVEVVARISTSGEPKPQAGDLIGVISPVAVQGQVDILDLSIDQTVE